MNGPTLSVANLCDIEKGRKVVSPKTSGGRREVDMAYSRRALEAMQGPKPNDDGQPVDSIKSE